MKGMHSSMSLQTPVYGVGHTVDVQGHGRATIIAPRIDDTSSPHYGRYLLRYHEDDTTFHCTTQRLRRVYPTSKRILVADSTEAYRDSVVHNVDRIDTCLEVGCHEGVTTNILSNRCKCVIGIDISSIVIGRAQRKFPHLTFRVADGFDVPRLQALLPPGGAFTKVCVDISGKAPLPLIVDLLVLYLKAFPSGTTFLVKNEALHAALCKAQNSEVSMDRPNSSNSNGSSQTAAPDQLGNQLGNHSVAAGSAEHGIQLKPAEQQSSSSHTGNVISPSSEPRVQSTALPLELQENAEVFMHYHNREALQLSAQLRAQRNPAWAAQTRSEEQGQPKELKRQLKAQRREQRRQQATTSEAGTSHGNDKQSEESPQSTLQL